MTETVPVAVTDAVTDPAPAIEFLSAYDQGFARVAAVTLPVVPVDPAANAAAIIEQARALADDGVCLAAFPELCLTGYAIDDLLLSDVLLSDVLTAIETLRAASADLLTALVVGAPLRLGDRLYNCALVIQGGSAALPTAPTAPRAPAVPSRSLGSPSGRTSCSRSTTSPA